MYFKKKNATFFRYKAFEMIYTVHLNISVHCEIENIDDSYELLRDKSIPLNCLLEQSC